MSASYSLGNFTRSGRRLAIYIAHFRKSRKARQRPAPSQRLKTLSRNLHSRTVLPPANPSGNRDIAGSEGIMSSGSDSTDMEGFHFEEFVNAVARPFPSEAGFLDAPKWRNFCGEPTNID